MKCKTTKSLWLLAFCAGCGLLHAQQPQPDNRLAPEPEQVLIQHRPIPPVPVSENAPPTATEKSDPASQLPVPGEPFDEDAAKEAAFRPIPPAPHDEKAQLPTQSLEKAKQPVNATSGFEEPFDELAKPPVKPIPPVPVNEKKGQDQ